MCPHALMYHSLWNHDGFSSLTAQNSISSTPANYVTLVRTMCSQHPLPWHASSQPCSNPPSSTRALKSPNINTISLFGILPMVSCKSEQKLCSTQVEPSSWRQGHKQLVTLMHYVPSTPPCCWPHQPCHNYSGVNCLPHLSCTPPHFCSHFFQRYIIFQHHFSQHFH